VNKMDLYRAFDAIDEEILERSEIKSVTARHFRWHYVFVAVLLSLCLMGAGVVAVVWGDNIQNMFSHYWRTLTGHEMSTAQTALIDHLSQKIALSQTNGNVTITVDSATVGDDSFFVLLRIEGLAFSDQKNYGFNETEIKVAPDPIEETGGMSSFGYNLHGIDGDGSVILIMEYDYITKKGYVEDTRPLEVEITFRDLMQAPHTDREKTLQSGEWTYRFIIDRTNPPAVMTLPDATVHAIDLTKRDEYTTVPVLLTDIEITNTGLRFKYDYQKGNYDIPAHIDVILKNGVSIGVGSASGYPLKDSDLLFCSYKWLVPIVLEEVTAVSFNGIIISIP